MYSPLLPSLPPSLPFRWFDLVLVVRADNATLFDRLSARGYSTRKREENLECEIMQVGSEEGREGGRDKAGSFSCHFVCINAKLIRNRSLVTSIYLPLPPFIPFPPPLPRWS